MSSAVAVRTLSAILRGRSSFAAAGKNLALRVASLAVNFGTGIIVARALGPTGRGELGALTLWPMLFASLATLGIPSSLNFYSRRKPEIAKRLYMVSVVLLLAFGGVAGAVGAVFIPLLLHGYDAGTIRAAQWFMLFAPETLVTYAARSHLDSRDQFTRSQLVLVYPSLATLFSLGVLRLTGHLIPITAALSYILPSTIQGTWMMGRLWQRTAFRVGELAADIRLLIPYGLRCYGSDVILTLTWQLDFAIVVAFLTPAQLGLYAVAMSVSRVVEIVHTSVIGIVLNRALSRDGKEAIELVARAARVFIIVCGCLAVMLALVARPAVTIAYGQSFAAAAPLIVLLIAQVGLWGLANVLLQAFMAAGRPAVVTLIEASSMVATIAFLALLVPRLQVTGAALAVLLAAFVRLMVVVAAYPPVLGRLPPRLLPTTADIAYLSATVRGLSRDASVLGVRQGVGSSS